LGFYNFALGRVPLFLLFAAYWRSVRERGDATAFVTTSFVLAALYLTHITALVAACCLAGGRWYGRAIASWIFGLCAQRQAVDDRRCLGCGRGAAGAAC